MHDVIGLLQISTTPLRFTTQYKRQRGIADKQTSMGLSPLPQPPAHFFFDFLLCLGVRVCVCGGGGGSCTLSSHTVAMLRNSRLTPSAPVAVTTFLMLWCNIKAPTSVISNSLSWWLIICFKMWTLLGRAWKIVYRLIILLLSTEIFSKRRKIYSLWRETRVPKWMAKKQVNDVKTAE